MHLYWRESVSKFLRKILKNGKKDACWTLTWDHLSFIFTASALEFALSNLRCRSTDVCIWLGVKAVLVTDNPRVHRCGSMKNSAVSLQQLTLQYQGTLMQGCSAWHIPASPSVIVQGGATPTCDVTLSYLALHSSVQNFSIWHIRISFTYSSVAQFLFSFSI